MNSWQDPINPGGSADPWPRPSGAWQRMRPGDNTFETKYASDAKTQFDGQKDGEQWESVVGNYLISRSPIMAHALRWAAARGNTPITKEAVESLRGWMDEDPLVVDHLLWGFLNINLTGAAREIFCNVGAGQGLEVWRRIHVTIYSKTEKRREIYYDKIHHPKSAANPSEVAKALEEWDTNQRIFRSLGGTALRDDELRAMLLKIVPENIRMKVIERGHDRPSEPWDDLKDYVKEFARLLMVHTGKQVPAHLAESQTICEWITDEFLEMTHDYTIEEQLLELGVFPTSCQELHAFVTTQLNTRKNAWRGGKGRKGGFKGNKGCGKGDRHRRQRRQGRWKRTHKQRWQADLCQLQWGGA